MELSRSLFYKRLVALHEKSKAKTHTGAELEIGCARIRDRGWSRKSINTMSEASP